MGSQRWGLLASLSGELLVLGLLLLIPLAWTDRLPHMNWQPPLRLIGPPPPARPVAPVETHASGPSSPHSPVRFRLDLLHPSAKPASHIDFEPTGELPPGVPGGVGESSGFEAALPVVKLAPPPEKPAVEAPLKPAQPQLMAVSKGAQLAKLIHQVVPVYPVIAIQNRVSGTVLLTGVISKDGTIRSLRVISGNPLLVRAALDAVSQWTYRPTLLNGEPIEVTAPIEVNFILKTQ